MEQTKNKYNQICYDERKIIERLLRKNTPKREIARLLNRSITTIRKEIKRGSVEQRKEIKTTKKELTYRSTLLNMYITLTGLRMIIKKIENIVVVNVKLYNVQNF